MSIVCNFYVEMLIFDFTVFSLLCFSTRRRTGWLRNYAANTNRRKSGSVILKHEIQTNSCYYRIQIYIEQKRFGNMLMVRFHTMNYSPSLKTLLLICSDRESSSLARAMADSDSCGDKRNICRLFNLIQPHFQTKCPPPHPLFRDNNQILSDIKEH